METILSNISILTAAPVLNVGLLIDGILIGAIFALAAYGLALVWGVMNVKNLAQGDFIMLGGYITWSLGRHDISPLFGVPVAFVLLWGFGWVIYRLVICKVITRDLFTSLLATFGIAIVIQQSLNLAFGSDTAIGAFRLADLAACRRFDHRSFHPCSWLRACGPAGAGGDRIHEEQPHGTGDPRHRAGRACRPRARH